MHKPHPNPPIPPSLSPPHMSTLTSHHPSLHLTSPTQTLPSLSTSQAPPEPSHPTIPLSTSHGHSHIQPIKSISEVNYLLQKCGSSGMTKPENAYVRHNTLICASANPNTCQTTKSYGNSWSHRYTIAEIPCTCTYMYEQEFLPIKNPASNVHTMEVCTCSVCNLSLHVYPYTALPILSLTFSLPPTPFLLSFPFLLTSPFHSPSSSLPPFSFTPPSSSSTSLSPSLPSLPPPYLISMVFEGVAALPGTHVPNLHCFVAGPSYNDS